MPSIVFEQGIVHYETYGRGRPVILMHGWLGSWSLWRNTIEILGKDFRTYALDFFGFGESVNLHQQFTVENYVDLVSQFMDRLGIVKAPLIGHSMGGTVSLAATIRYPEKVVKSMVIGSPIVGTSLNFLLRMSGYRGIARVFWSSPVLLRLFLQGYAYFIARDGRGLGKMFNEDFKNISPDSFFQSIGTLRQTDLRDQLHLIKTPVMGIYGRTDQIVSPRQHQVLKEYLPHSQIAWFEKSGHFPMLDEPDRFYTTLNDFLLNG